MIKLPTNRRRTRTKLTSEIQADQLYREALAALQAKDNAKAIRTLTQALTLEPLHVTSLMLQARLFAKYDKFDPAIELMQLAVTLQPDELEACFDLGLWLTKAGKHRAAAAMMQRCVDLRPSLANPRHYLAAIYGNMGHDTHSRYWAKKSVTSNAFTVAEAKTDTKLTVLALFTRASGSLGINRNTLGIHTSEGHNNLTSLLDSDHITVIRFSVDALDSKPKLLDKLPPADIIYNSITDPERCEHALHLAQKVCDRLDLPVINAPKAVLAASREGNYARFKDNPTIVLPKAIKFENVQGSAKTLVEKALAEEGLTLPVIIRLAGFQGGLFMHKVDDLTAHDFTELDTELAKQPQTAYVIQYHDVSYVDERMPDARLYPKYRAFMVGGKLYPAHRFVDADNFNVHLKNYAKMLESTDMVWLRDAMDNYVDAPEQHFLAGEWAELEKVMQSFNMEYVGVDFAPCTSKQDKGKILIFEANAGMRNRLDDLPLGDDRRDAFEAVINSAHHNFCEKSGIEPWDFKLPAPKTTKVGGLEAIPDNVKFLDKKTLPDKSASNQRWLAERLGQSNDYSESPYFNTQFYIDEELLEHTARQKNIRVQRHPFRMLEFTQGQKQVVFHINAPRIPIASHLLDADKTLLKTLFKANGIPTPEGEDFSEFDEAYRYFASRTRPQVVKPSNGFGSRGVSVHITTPEAFQIAWQKAKAIGSQILVEDMIQGEELRVYFINNEFMAATVRTRAFVIGDGKKTINELIEAKNVERTLNPATANAPIKATHTLERSGRSKQEVPAKDEWVALHDSRIAADGSEHITLGKSLPKAIITIAKQAAALLPSAVCGVDIFIEDLANPKNSWVTEINSSTPAIGSQFHFPRYGKPTEVAPHLLDHAFEKYALPLQPRPITLQPAQMCKVD